jgi:hypothetical protein
MGLAIKKTSRTEPSTAAGPGPLRAIPVPAALEAGHPPDDNPVMSTPVTREELDAKLFANVAEIKLVAHEVHVDIGALRAEIQTHFAANQAQFSSIQAQFVSIQALFEKQAARAEVEAAKSEARFEALTARIDAESIKNEARFVAVDAKLDGVEKVLEGKIDGQRAELKMLQWVIVLVATLAGLAITCLR